MLPLKPREFNHIAVKTGLKIRKWLFSSCHARKHTGRCFNRETNIVVLMGS